MEMRVKEFWIIGVLCALLCGVSTVHAEEAAVAGAAEVQEVVTEEAEAVGFLDAAIVDQFFDTYLAAPIKKVTGDTTLGISEIPGLDPALTAFADMSPLDFKLGFALASSYIWRGQNLGSDASFQPFITVSPSFEPLGDLSFTFWADITKNSPGENQREYDFVVDYVVGMQDVLGLVGYEESETPYLVNKLVDFSFDTGYIYYKFPPQPDTKTQEVYWGVMYDLPLHPSFFIYNDWDRGNGMWYEAGLSQNINFGLFTLATYAKLGYNDEQWGRSSALSTLDMGASIPIPLGTHMTLEPFLSFTKRLEATYIDDGSTDLTHDELYGGLKYSITF